MKTTTISVADARRDFAKVLSHAATRGKRIKVRRYGTTLAGIISKADLTHLEECDEALGTRRRPKRPPRAQSRK
ncbi:MAG TPA: hypothetical protein VF103_02480 [Polyangiaceae bacterium]